MKSFDIHFNNQGTVLIDNITGVDPNSSECLEVTKTYLENFGGVVNLEMISEEAINSDSVRDTESL
jgi:hypothetical protein